MFNLLPPPRSLIIVITLSFLLPLASQAMAVDSSCISCHTDEELLIENLAPPTHKKSAKQAGAG